MHFRKKHLLPILLILVLALALSACQGPAPSTNTDNTEAASATPTQQEQAQPSAAPSPTAEEAEAATPEADSDTGFQEVDATLGKTIFPPEAPASFAPADRPNSTIGQDDAPITMYEWCDYGYPNCVVYANDILPELQKKYVDTGKLRIVHKEFPAAGGDPSVVASLAAQCAGEQGEYEKMSKWLYRDPSWSQAGEVPDIIEAVKAAAKDMGLDADAFNTCMDEQQTLETVKQDYFEARDLEFHDLPGVVINGRVIQDGVSADQLDVIIDAMLQQQETGSLPDTVITVTPSPTPDTDFEPETVAVMGDPDAPVLIVEFTDFQCPFCRRYDEETLPQIKKEYIDTGKVRYMLKHFPLTQIHPQAVPAAIASECAGEQGKFWEMHDKLFSQQDQWSGKDDANSTFKTFAKDLGLDEKAFDECITAERYKDKVMDNQKEGMAAGVQGTPAFFVNGQFISGAQPFQVFQQMIEKALGEQQ